MDKLRECPFCGGEAEICKEVPPERLNHYDCVDDYTMFFIGCKKCKARGWLWVGGNKIPEAIKEWNTRHEPLTPGGILVPFGNARFNK